MYKNFVIRQSEQERYTPKKDLLLQSPLNNPAQAVAVSNLSSGGNALDYNVVKKRPLVFPQDHIRHPGVISDWYFLVGQLISNETGEKFAFVSVFQAFYVMGPDLLYSGENYEDVHLEEIMLIFTSAKDQKTYQAPHFVTSADNMILPTLKHFKVGAPNFSLIGTGPNPFPMSVAMTDSQNDIQLRLAATAKKPMLLQGDHGYVGFSKLGEGWGYYSYPFLDLTGKILYKGESISVSGIGWFDHQWGTTGAIKNGFVRFFTDMVSVFKSPGTFAGWNWFAIQVEDANGNQTEFTTAYGNLYNDKGFVDIVSTPHKAVYGNFSFPDGSNREANGDILITTLDYTQSPNNFKYPIKWRLQVPEEGFDVTITTISPTQFGTHASGTEWAENACTAMGIYKGQKVEGVGWGECVGFEGQDSANSAMLRVAGINPLANNLQILKVADSRVSRDKGIRNLLILIFSIILVIIGIIVLVRYLIKRHKQSKK